MRKALIAICALFLTAAVVVGVRQTGTADDAAPLSLAEVSKPIAGAPPKLAALRARVNELRGGGLQALDAQLMALRGTPVVVNLWASWCDPCRRELPFLQRQAVQRGARVAFLGVNVGDERGQAKALAARYPMPYPSFEDPRSRSTGRYKARGLPTTAFYDASGKLEIVHQGAFPTGAKLAEAIERYALGGAARR